MNTRLKTDRQHENHLLTVFTHLVNQDLNKYGNPHKPGTDQYDNFKDEIESLHASELADKLNRM